MPFFLYSECLNSGCLELVKRRDEGIHAGFVSVLLREVDSGELQQLDRAVASAGREVFELVVDSGLSFGENPVRDRDGGDDSGRVLVDIERTVEVRDARPLIGNFRVGDD